MARRRKPDDNLRSAFKGLIIVLFLGFGAYVIGSRTVYFCTHARVFKITEIIKSPALQFIDSWHLEQLKGKNIFLVNLSGVQRRVQAEYPSVERLHIIRQLPNRILVTAEKRDPYAVVSMGSQEVALDDRGVVLSGEVPARGKLPYISGVDDVADFRGGKRLSGQKAGVALAIINAVRRDNYLQKLSVESVDVSNLSKIRLYFSNHVEIILDRFTIDEKIYTLGLLLSDVGVPIEEINYIDIRFKEPIVNKK